MFLFTGMLPPNATYKIRMWSFELVDPVAFIGILEVTEKTFTHARSARVRRYCVIEDKPVTAGDKPGRLFKLTKPEELHENDNPNYYLVCISRVKPVWDSCECPAHEASNTCTHVTALRAMLNATRGEPLPVASSHAEFATGPHAIACDWRGEMGGGEGQTTHPPTETQPSER